MSRLQMDQVIDDEEPESCPLCIEDFDLSDRSFYPCPCGYQICQFCYNNIKTTMNGLCPACRRVYKDEQIKWEAPSAEEQAQYKENQVVQAKKKAAARQKEAQRREADSLSRKHLAGIRVRRQNLVYVTGLKLNTSDPQLSEKLRGDQFFGQYGLIDKIVVNRPKDSRSMQPVGVYITYFDKQAAALCISMVNGTSNAGGVIRADYGTTKYCSAYLRNEICTNRNCTFLHETGEDNESFTREGLSNLNASSSQSPTVTNTNQPPPPQPSKPTPPSLSAPMMDRQESKDGGASPVDSSDGSALPSTASWAQRNISRRSSQAQSQSASITAPSPAVIPAVPVAPQAEIIQPEETKVESQQIEVPTPATLPSTRMPAPPPGLENVREQTARIMDDILPPRAISPTHARIKKFILTDEFKFVFDVTRFENEPNGLRTLQFIDNFPPLWDANGGMKRQISKRQEAERARLETDRQVASQALSVIDPDENAQGGSLQLGGEPEELNDLDNPLQQHAIQPPSQSGSTAFGLTSQQQQQQILLQQLKSASPNPPVSSNPPPGVSGHTRQASRFSFANDSSSASASVKPVANPKLMNQQSAMMPPPHAQQYGAFPQQQPGQAYSSGVQGPPPGLKTAGTPAISGGGMFGQGYGFATAGLGYGVNASGRTANDEMMRDLLRNRGGSTGGGQTPDNARADLSDPSILQARMHQGSGANQGLYGSQGQDILASSLLALQDDPFIGPSKSPTFALPRLDDGSRRSTPSLPPGLGPPPGLPTSTRRLSTENTTQDVPVFSGLGVPPNEARLSERRTPSPISPPKKPTVQDVPIPQPVSTTVPDKSNTPVAPSVPAAFDASSFPALPKPTSAAVNRQNKAERAAERMLARMQRDERQKENKDENKVDMTKPDDNVPVIEDKAENEETVVQPLSKRRQGPGKLEIPAATEIMAAENESAFASPVTTSKPGTPSRSLREATETPSVISRAATPVATPAVDTPLKRVTQPRTIRVLATPTPKTEIPVLPPIINEFRASTPAGSVRPSRQGSTASINIPGTPASERISDTISITTDTISRADSSPPPGPNRVGSAPVRAKTKSQAKKDRQERAKAEEKKVVEAVTTAASPAETVVQEAIMGRKKKTKKEKIATARSTAPSTPGQSRAPSPRPTPKQETPKAEKAQAVPEVVAEQPSRQEAKVAPVTEPVLETAPLPSPIPAPSIVPEIPPNAATEPAAPKAASPPPLPQAKPSLAPASLFSELEASGQVDAETLLFFKTLNGGFNFRNEVTAADLADIKAPLPLTNEELAKLGGGEAVHRGGENGRVFSRVMVTPSHKAIRALSKELEEKYLELEVQVNSTKPPLKYTHKNMNANIASVQFLVEDILKEAAVQLLQPLDPATGTPVAPHPRATANAESVVYGDDALAYLNQFILPPVAPAQQNRKTQPQSTYSPQQPVPNPSPNTNIPNRNNNPAMTMTAEQMNLLATQAKSLSSSLGIENLGLTSLDGPSSADHRKIKQAFHKAVQGVVQVAAGIASSIGGQQEQGVGQEQQGQVMGGGLSESELEREYLAKRKECERLEKQVSALMKKNRKAVGLQGA